jgi:hypothetical protein
MSSGKIVALLFRWWLEAVIGMTAVNSGAWHQNQTGLFADIPARLPAVEYR